MRQLGPFWVPLTPEKLPGIPLAVVHKPKFFCGFSGSFNPLKNSLITACPLKILFNYLNQKPGRYNSILLKIISSPKFSMSQGQTGRGTSPSFHLSFPMLPLLYADLATVPLPVVSSCCEVVSLLYSESIQALQHMSNRAVSQLAQV